jgi:phage replication O-like protein O
MSKADQTPFEPTPRPGKLAAPNWTQVPNALLDNLHIVSDAELRVLLVVIRQTVGWHRNRHKLSISFLCRATDMSSQGVINATKSLIARGVIVRYPKEDGFEYELVLTDEPTPRRLDPLRNAVDTQPRVEKPLNAVESKPVNAVGTNKERVLKKGKKVHAPRVPLSKEEKEQAEEIYKLYPRRVGKPVAIKAIAKAIKTHTLEHVKTRTMEFAQAWEGGDLTFCPHPATWFNQDRFNDAPEEWIRQKREKSRETAKKEGGATPSGPQEF